MDDFRKFMYTALIAFILLLVVWISIVYVSACGFTLTCHRGQPIAARTPVPTLAAATLPVSDFSVSSPTISRCRVPAVELLGAWVNAGYSDTETFTFTDVDGNECKANFTDDIQLLFLEANLWFPGSLSCAACHQSDMDIASAQLDLSTYEGMLRGVQLTASDDSQDEEATDIFGDGVWENSLLYDSLSVRKNMPLGRPPDLPAEGPVIFAGIAVQEEGQ
jgi:hypothetical protein